MQEVSTQRCATLPWHELSSSLLHEILEVCDKPACAQSATCWTRIDEASVTKLLLSAQTSISLLMACSQCRLYVSTSSQGLGGKGGGLVVGSCVQINHTEARVLYDGRTGILDDDDYVLKYGKDRLVSWLLSDWTTCLPGCSAAPSCVRPSTSPCWEVGGRPPLLDGRYKVASPKQDCS